jgi:hypothetical protein
MHTLTSELGKQIEQELREKNQKFFDDLQKIKYTAKRIFDERPNIPWYTDHSGAHSRRVVDRIFSLLDPLQQRLSAQELFVLLASCYLHDIGMFYFKITGKTYPYDPSDYDLIRQRHSGASASLIMENAAYLDDPRQAIELPIPQAFTDAISLVCRAHSTDYFINSCSKLEIVPTISGGYGEFRGPLLAALLLMGDELDLDSERSEALITRFSSKWDNFPPDSILHIFGHHYVRKIQILHEGGLCRLEVTFQFPPDSIKYSHDLIYWVVTKLLRQCRLTYEILRPLGIIWDNKIKVVRIVDSPSRKDLPPEARPLLAEISAQRRIVDRETVKERLLRYACGEFDSSEAILVHGLRESDHEVLGDWFLSACHCRRGETSYKYLDFNELSPYHINDIRGMVRRLRVLSNRPVAIIRNLHLPDPAVYRWLMGTGFAQLLLAGNEPPVAVVGFADHGPPNDESASLPVEVLAPFHQADLSRYLERIGCPVNSEQSILISMDTQRLSPGYVIGKMDLHLDSWIPIEYKQ